MDIQKKNQERSELNQFMSGKDDFFQVFGKFDDNVYSEGFIPKKCKELTGLFISVLTRRNECILYLLLFLLGKDILNGCM